MNKNIPAMHFHMALQQCIDVMQRYFKASRWQHRPKGAALPDPYVFQNIN